MTQANTLVRSGRKPDRTESGNPAPQRPIRRSPTLSRAELREEVMAILG